MTRLSTLLLALLCPLLGPLLCQCQVGPAGRWVSLRPTDRVVVSYQRRSDGGLQQTLCGGSQFSAREAYSKKGADPGVKVARLDDIQRLLDEFGRNRFFTKARPTAPADCKQLLSVEVNGHHQVFAMLPRGSDRSQQDVLDFIACKQAFVRAFNVTTGFSSGNTSVAELEKQQAEFRERARRLQQGEAKKAAANAGKSGKQ